MTKFNQLKHNRDLITLIIDFHVIVINPINLKMKLRRASK